MKDLVNTLVRDFIALCRNEDSRVLVRFEHDNTKLADIDWNKEVIHIALYLDDFIYENTFHLMIKSYFKQDKEMFLLSGHGASSAPDILNTIMQGDILLIDDNYECYSDLCNWFKEIRQGKIDALTSSTVQCLQRYLSIMYKEASK